MAFSHLLLVFWLHYAHYKCCCQQEVDENDLLMSLKASTEDIKSKLFNNMSERRREMVEEDLEKMPPAKLKDVLSAQKRLLAVVKELCQSGQIEIVREAEQEAYV